MLVHIYLAERRGITSVFCLRQGIGQRKRVTKYALTSFNIIISAVCEEIQIVCFSERK